MLRFLFRRFCRLEHDHVDGAYFDKLDPGFSPQTTTQVPQTSPQPPHTTSPPQTSPQPQQNSPQSQKTSPQSQKTSPEVSALPENTKKRRGRPCHSPQTKANNAAVRALLSPGTKAKAAEERRTMKLAKNPKLNA
jgi:hypothetical protein